MMENEKTEDQMTDAEKQKRAERFLDTPETAPRILRYGNKSSHAKKQREAEEAAKNENK